MGPLVTRCPDHRSLEPRRVKGKSHADEEERQERPRVPPADPAVPPPDDDEEDGGKDARGRLGEEGQREGDEACSEEEGRPLMERGPPERRPLLFRLPFPRCRRSRGRLRGRFLRLAGVSPGEERVGCEEREDEGEGVLPLRDPGDGLHADGVQREGRGGKPGAGEGEAPEEPPEKQRTDPMEEDVDDVVSEGVEPPDSLLDPVGREDERVVLLVRPRVGPDPREAPGTVQRPVLGDVGRVVPDEPGCEDRQVGGDDREEERGSEGRAGFLLHVSNSAPRAGCPHTRAPEREAAPYLLKNPDCGVPGGGGAEEPPMIRLLSSLIRSLSWAMRAAASWRIRSFS